MELSSEAQFHLRNFSPHRLTYLPQLGTVLATDSRGRARCIDVVTGAELHPPAVEVPPSESGRCPPPVHFALHPETSKLVVASGNRLGARSSEGGSVLMGTILQLPVANPLDEVCVEVPMEQVMSILKDFQIMIYVVIPELLRAIRNIQVQLEKSGPMLNLKHNKCATAKFTGKAQQLCDSFKELVSKLKSSVPPTSLNHAKTFVMALPCLPILSAWQLRTQLLLPESHGKVVKFESATELPTMDTKMMHVEGVRKLTLVNWPHREYVWAVPKKMAEAGFYHLANSHGSQASISSGKGDRVSCFACKMYLYSWEPTDEPWSEHERHTGGCPYVRGDYTENVPAASTEASHPAVECSDKGDSVVCISSTGMGTGLIAVGTELGHISIWELDRGLLIMKHCECDIKITDGVVETTSQSEDKLSPGGETKEGTETTEVVKVTAQVSFADDVKSADKEKVEAAGEEEVKATPPDATPPIDDDEVVKSKIPASAETRDDVSENQQPTRKRNFHITALSILSPPPPKEDHTPSPAVAPVSTGTAAAGSSEASTDKKASSEKADKSSSKDPPSSASPTPPIVISPSLISAVSVTNGGRCTPTLLVYSIKSNRPLDKGKSDHKVKPPMPPPPDPLDYDPWEPIELAPSYMGNMQTSSSTSSVLDVLSETKQDGNSSPADLKYIHSIPLDEFSCGADSGGMPEIKEIVPLAGGQLVAVLCNMSSTSPLLASDDDQSTKDDTALRGGFLLFRTSIEEDGDRMRLRVDENPLSVVRFTDHSSAVVSMCLVTAAKRTEGERKPADSKEEERHEDILLGTISRRGDVVVYDCASLELKPIGQYTCHADLVSHDLDQQSRDQSCDSMPVECVSCTYCPPTFHLAVADSSGHVTFLSLRELLLARERLVDAEEVETTEDQTDAFFSRPLTSVELDQLLLPTKTSPDGVPYSLSLPSHWKEITYFQLHRQSPVHLHLGEGKKVTTRVWQHQPPSMEHCRENRYVFELTPESAITTPIGCVNVSVTIANRRSLNDLATVSLLTPRLETPPSFAYQVLNWKPYDILCGPVKIKPLIDVTEQSLQFSLFHPFLVTRRPHVLWVELKDFFAHEYNDISVTTDNSSSASKRSGWKSGSHRLRQQNDSKVKPVAVQCTIAVTLHPTASPLDALSSMTIKPGTLFKLVSDPEFMCHVTLAVCGYRVEEKELSSLPESLKGLLKEGMAVSTVESQFKALELLSWMVGVHLSNANSGGYSLISSTISQVLTSLLHACFIRGNRSLIHKCARLVVTLHRGREDNRSDFRYSLNNALVQLLPVLPLASSAACIHFFLRLVATLTESCDSHMISRICLTLLVELTKQLNSRSTFASQLLQTHFKHDGHVFEPELFDIYLSYCQKSSSMIKPQPKYTGSYLDPDYDYYGLFQPEPILPTLPPDWSHIDPNSSTVISASVSAMTDSSTLQVIADKGGHTIYDMELQLLLDCSKKTKAQAVKAIDEYSTFKHGSFLLYSQRGLLETLPIHYQCLSVSGDAQVQEANVHTLPTVPEGAPSSTSAAPVIAVSKTMGYSFPASAGETGGGGRKPADKSTAASSSSSTTGAAPSSTATTSVSERAQMQRLPPVISDILVSAKELVMQIPSLKSGLAYTAILKFPHPIYLTDISIPAAVYMSSVSVDVWLEEGGEKDSVRVAHSPEIRERSMILGNLMPAPLCQFAKVTFVGRLGANREKAQVFIGSFYGRPIFSGESSVTERQLLSLEENILSQYHASRERLSQALLSYAGLSRKGGSDGEKQSKLCEEKVASSYQECFKAQVQLARLRHFTKAQKEQEKSSNAEKKDGEGDDDGAVFSIDEEARSLNFQDLTFSRLSKIVGCLVDALLVLNGGTYTAAETLDSSPVPRKPFQRTIRFDPEPPQFEDKIIDEFLEWSPVAPPTLSQSECSLLFLALCIHGVPKLHARACALLTRLCGSQEWWGKFVTDMTMELFHINQPGVFNKERALLQLSILSQRTYDVSNVVECLLQLLEEKLTQLIQHGNQKGGGDSSFDHTLLQWIILLLSHVLASIAMQNQPKSHTNLFVPLPLLPSSLVLSLTQPKEEIDGESRRAELAERRRELKRMLTTLGQKIEFASAEEKVKLKEEFDGIFIEYQSLRKQLLAHHRLMRQQRNAAAAAAKNPKSSSQKDKEKEKEKEIEEDLVKHLDPDPALSSLPHSLCQNVAKGLVHYIGVLTSGDSWDFLPVACKSLSQMVALTSWSYPLHSLVSQEQLNTLIAFRCQHVTSPHSTKTAGSLEWGQRAVECLLIDILHHGEIKPYFDSLNKQEEVKVAVFGEKPLSPAPPTHADILKKALLVVEKEEKEPFYDEQELKKMEKMFNKAPLEIPQILLSCGDVEIPLNRRTWKGRVGKEEWAKKKVQVKKEVVTAKDQTVPKEEGSTTGAKEGETKMADDESKKTKAVAEPSSVKTEVSVAVATRPAVAPKESKMVKIKDMDSVGGLSVPDLKRYLRHTYLQGDFEHMVDFPPPEKHSYGLALHNPLPVSLSPSPYLSYIISNAFDYRVLSSLEVSAELELQQLAKKVYESVLHSLLHARPAPDSANESLPGEMSPIAFGREELVEMGNKPFAVSTGMLTHAVEELLTKAQTPHSNLNIVSVLEFCSDINSLLPVTTPLLFKAWRPQYTTKELQEVSVSTIPHRNVQLAIGFKWDPEDRPPFIIAPISSNEIISLLFNCLLNTQNSSSKMWQLSISVLHTSLRYLWNFVAEKRRPIIIDTDQLMAVFMKLISSPVDSVELCDYSFIYMLNDFLIMWIPRKDEQGYKWYGIHLLFELLIKILEKRDTSYLNSTLLLDLLQVLSINNHLQCLFCCRESLLYEVVGLMKKLCVGIIDLLPDFLEQARHCDVILYGGEQDEENRRYRYIRPSGQDTKVRWISVAGEASRRNRVAAELIQLLREVLMLIIPCNTYEPLEAYCNDSFLQQVKEEGGDVESVMKQERVHLKLAPGNNPVVSLVYSDVQLMTKILKLLSSTAAYHNEIPPAMPPVRQAGNLLLDPTMVQSLFCNFVRYLDNHCKDHSCFFEPILRALRSTSSELQMSKTFMAVVGRLTTEFGSDSSKEKLMNFVSEGGGHLALECLVNGCKQVSPSIRRGIMTQSINKLGQKDTLKPTASGSHHVNFFPLATVRLKPNRTSVKELQSSSTTDHPTRTACFNHAYQGDEEWLRMQISLPYPILLHTVQFLQPMGMFQSGPSAVFIECGTQGTLSAPTPVTPLMQTIGLPCIKIEFKQPPVASEVVIHFRSPVVSNTLALSHMQVLGTGFGSSSKSGSSSSAQSGKSGSGGHSSTGWLLIIDQWMNLSKEISDKLLSISASIPDFLSAALSLLQHQDTLSTKSCKQLKRLLVAMAMYSQDYGTAIVQHLLGFSPGERMTGSPAAQGGVPITTMTLDLLHQLCVPNSEENKQRLHLALRLLSNVPLSQGSLSHHLPTLIRVLSSTVWEGGQASSHYDEGIFNSLAEHAFSLDVTSALKSSLNSLLCSLCYCVSDYFTSLLSNCSHLLGGESENRTKLLHTLAHVAQSEECTAILLRSDLMSEITVQLYDGFDQLLKAAKQANPDAESETSTDQSSDMIDMRSLLSSLCSSLAFLTDFIRNWTPGKDWMVLEENRRFWPLMVELFSMDMACITKAVQDNSTSSVLAFELSFCQKVVLEYFSACLSNHTESKRAFVRMVCNSICGTYSFDAAVVESESDSNSDSKSDSKTEPVLTPFLHNLLLELVLQPETIPVVLKFVEDKNEELLGKPLSSFLSSLTFTPTHECVSFHPSFPVGSTCYLLELSPSSPLSKLASLLNPSSDKSTPAKPKKDPVPVSSGSTLSSLKLPLTRKAKPPPAPPSSHSIEINEFELKKWLLPGSSFNPSQDDSDEDGKSTESMSKVELVLPFDTDRMLEEKSTFGGLLEKAREVAGQDCGPALVLLLQKNDLVQHLVLVNKFGKRPSLSATSSDESLLSLFVTEGGLRSLSLCLPSLYRYQWPEKTLGLPVVQLSSTEEQVTKKLSLFVSQVLLRPPNILPFHSILMLGLCLRVDNFDSTLSQNLAMVFVLMRLVLGTELEDLPYALSHHLCFLPYLVLLETLKALPTHTPEGCNLRRQLLEVGVVHHTLQCLSSAGHHSPRVDSGETTSSEPMQMEGGRYSSKIHRPKVTTSSDHHYWAKGTGFGTGSTASNWNLEALAAKQKSEEKYVCLCFTILAEFLSLGATNEVAGAKSGTDVGEAAPVKSEGGEGGEAVTGEGGEAVKSEDVEESGPAAVKELPEYCTLELAELLSDSCLLPAMASYLLNDSVLDISKHIELYQSMLDLLSSIVDHPTLCHLLRLPVFSSDNGSSGDETTLASLIAKLREITKLYQKTAKAKQPKSKKSMILHTDVPLSMLLTSFYTYKPPQTRGEKLARALAVVTKDQAVPVVKEEKKKDDKKEPVKPVDQPAKPVDQDETQPEKKDEDKSASETDKPAEQTDEGVEPDKPAEQDEQPAEPVEQPDKPTEQVADKPAEQDEQPAKPAEQPEKPAEVPDKPDEQPDKPTEQVAEQPDKLAEQPDKPAEEPEKPAELTDKPAEQAVKPDEQAEKPYEQPDKPAEQPDIPDEQTDKPAEEPEKPAEQPDKPAEQPDKPAEQVDKEEKLPDTSKEAGDVAKPAGEAPPPALPPRLPPRNIKRRSDVTDLAALVKKILSVSEGVAKVVSELKRKEGSCRQASVSTPIAESAPASFDFYMKAMKPLQFDTYQILEENEYGTLRWHVPFHFHARVQSATSSTQNAARSRRLAQEVATLSTSLPLSPSSSVFVRCDEERLDVMKVLITGPSETPYANGCFEFDVFFPPEYPKSPMLVHMRTTGQGRVRFNPNLYNDGKVCLSVLNTWHGRPEEKWNPQNSSFLQVLVSIQSLILVPEPYFNEPGYEQYRGTPFGDQKSLAYNANIYASTVQWAMVDAIRNTSACFKEVILQHFYLHKSKVLEECEEWKKQLVDGISKMQDSGAIVNHIKEYLRMLAKATETLKVELEKIKPEDFQREGEEEEAETS